MTRHLGSCLCGGASFEILGDFEQFFFCHCEHCRKDTGSAHAANLFSSSAELRWLSGKDHVRTFNLPGTRHTRSFCSVCGSAMPHAAEHFIVVPAGCLDTDPAVAPTAHIFVASRSTWAGNMAALPMFDSYPG